jgi:hypothetical protein
MPYRTHGPVFAQDAPPARFPGGYTRPDSDTESAA